MDRLTSDRQLTEDASPKPSYPSVGILLSAARASGAVTEGAASSPTGSTTYHVTTLADSGTGSLRDAVSQGNRRIVFDVGGTIVLHSTLNIAQSYLTIDGATAPPPGITIEQPGDAATVLEARNSVGPIHDVIIRYRKRACFLEEASP